MNKPYRLLDRSIIEKGKGIVNNRFARYIGPADSLFSILIRSFGHRDTAPQYIDNYHFIIYDKDPAKIKFFKEMFNWQGTTDVGTAENATRPSDYKTFVNLVDDLAKKLNLEINFDSKSVNNLLGMTMRNDFYDFKDAWDKFRQCKFTFLEIDVIKNNEEFVKFLFDLEEISSSGILRQFIKFDFNPNDYAPGEYKEALNNVLHGCWRRSIRSYQTVVEAADDDNQSYEDFAGKIYAKLNPTFCVLPWMHIQYKPTGQAKLCCRYDNIKEQREFESGQYLNQPPNLAELFLQKYKNLDVQNSPIEKTFFDSHYWNEARRLTIENKPISGCHKCYQEEQVEGDIPISMRLGSSILYNDGYLHKKPNFEKPIIEFLEVGFGNYCNLACLSCNSSLSTTWHDDEVKLNAGGNSGLTRMIFPKLDNLKFEPDEETLKTLRLIKFTGGEPMINPEFIKFIELICEKGRPEQINLEIYTNCSYVPSPKLLENLTRFKEVQLNLSIDAYGSVNDYLRFGSTWDDDQTKQTVSRSLDFWLAQALEHRNLKIIMSTTLSVLNVFEIPKLMEWWIDYYKKSGHNIILKKDALLSKEYQGFFKLQLAFDPAYISMDILPAKYFEDISKWCDNYRENFTQKYPEFCDESGLSPVPECLKASVVKLQNTIARCKGNTKNAMLLLDYLDKMDNIRGNSASAAIPVVIARVKEYLLTQGIQT